MRVLKWDVPVIAPWRRSVDLHAVQFRGGDVTLDVQEEDGNRWRIHFHEVKALRVTTFESAYHILKDVEQDGGFFEVHDSRLCIELGKGVREYMGSARHLLVCCYDEVVEIVCLQAVFSQLDTVSLSPNGSEAGMVTQ